MLNMYEKILIQRAKAFQTIVKMDTVMKKNLPHHVKIDKVKGRTFHLPLPLEETLKKICPDTDPLNTNHELFVLIRSNPTKGKIIWEDYVDVTKIWKALHWLKCWNPLYAEVVIPASAEDLLSRLQNLELEYKDNLADVNIDEKCEKNIVSAAAALLTQKIESDSYYDQYTIYPLHDKKINETDTKLYQMLKIYASALDVRGKDLDLKCFPDLFPFGICGQHEVRSMRLRDYDYIRSRLTSRHPQFRLNIQYLFYLLYNHNIRQISAGIFHKLNVVNPHYKYTAGELLEKLEKDQLESNMETIFSNLRGTEAYWKRPRNDLDCMMNEYGPATFFVTLSPGEWMWSALGEYIREVNGWEDNKKSISELISADPVSASRYINNKFQGMLRYILSSAHPIGNVAHYYYACEYQGRGLPHYHCLFWITGAPIYGKSSNEDVQSFILQNITCRIPDKRISPELYRRVQSYQQHKHNNYCMRKKKTKTGFRSACRFGFPRPVTTQLILRSVSVAISNRKNLKNRSRFYDLPRKQEEVCVNDYMPALLVLWEGNNDAQFICESSYLLTKYVSSYGTKGEKSVVDFSDIQSNKSLCSRLWSFSLRALNHRECGAIEAADTLLGHPLHATDSNTLIRWLDVRMVRNRRLKPYHEIKHLPSDSTDIFYDSFIDTYYPMRPKELDSVCLYDFAKYFDIIKKKPVYKAEYYEIAPNLFCKKRKKPYLINHWKYHPKTQPECYFYALLLLFQPWQDINELKNDEDTYTNAFNKKQYELVEAMKYHDKCQVVQEAMNTMNEMIQKQLLLQEENGENKSLSNNLPSDCVPVETENAMKDFEIMAKKIVANEKDLENCIKKFNEDQLRVFDKITSILQSDKVLRIFISGPGGTGKSFIIENLVLWNKIIREKDTAVTAPTGIAAYNIEGLTVHRLLQLPVEHGCTAKYKQLSQAALKQIKQSLKNVDLIIIDEISMISNVILMYIHLRLTEIFDTSDCDDGWFGKKHIVVFGDLLQLPPVREEFPFVELRKAQINKYIGGMEAYNLWNLFDYDELTINMRQKNDKLYSEILSRLRLGFLTNTDIENLQGRKITFSSQNKTEIIEELCQYLFSLPTDTVCLLPTRNMCNILNDAMLRKINTEEIKLFAIDSFKCPKNLEKTVLKMLNEDDDTACGIERVIKIKIGSKIMIRRNIDVSIGLVNGTIGIVISACKDKTDKITSIRIKLQTGNEYSIEQFEYKFIIMNKVYIIRKQFPICNSYGITIHKSQGLSLKNAVVEAGNSIFSCGQTYVALSRVTTIEGLHLINFDPSCVMVDELAILEYNKLRQKYRPDLLPFEITKKINQTHKKILDIRWFHFKNVLAFEENSELNCTLDDCWNVRGLPNDGNSCYANACIQSLLHASTIRRILIHSDNFDPLKIVFNQYISKNTVNVMTLRRSVHSIYGISKQQDAAEFLTHLCEKSTSLRDILRHELITTIRCPGCDERSNPNTSPNYILMLALPDSKTPHKLQDIIDHNIGNWLSTEATCSNNCKMKLLQKTDVNIKNNILILQLLIFSVNELEISKVSKYKINEIPKTVILINKKKYKVVSGIFHHGNTIDSGHYTNVIRQNDHWIKISDLNIAKKTWPKGARDAYILFLERI